MAIQQYELRASWADFRGSYRREISAVPGKEYFRAAGDDHGGGLHRHQNSARRGGVHAVWIGTRASRPARGDGLVFRGGRIVHDAFGPGEMGYCLPAEKNTEREVLSGIHS